ncbi:dTDP-4-dehydrorhamnose 3,5-epimerase [Rhodohalobacter barkolensis]|uniref:dTDP-4-dehydrorhamnose 3,5-epimerase n=1 Tax=Rhodohalobacter barkolensis TaxID=2053187 RepID=A0A2N0VFL9_9BACT|nr:dTDP-4-dehydrorhamnose 3,5-epimerase [Rhodohalobacter barkolensis]PKD42975.1 dTDP-4-dehydrorhamnose 3,5-epimerase [Rhodohalobacter barkolensis]
MKFEETSLQHVWLIKPDRFKDERGEFLETFRVELFKDHGLEFEFVQDNISVSKKGTVRGLHYQLPPASQGKLVMVPKGKILDVAVDMRQNSQTFKQHYATILSSENRHMMFIPTGFAHGFSVLSDEATVYYKCNDYYNKKLERGVKWDDPDLNIDWKVEAPILSEKDKNLPLLSEMDEHDLF